MKSLWDDDEAARWPGDLGQRVYTSRLLGRDSSLVLHGGGNTSVKVREPNLFGEAEDLLYVKGSGWDLETIEAAGFAPVRHTARVVLFVPRTQAPRTHMFLTVACDGGRFVVDPGFGSRAPPFPVPLTDASGPPPDTTHWMARADGHWVLRARTPERVVDCWATTLEPDNPVDFELGNHFTATHPSSPFVNRLMLRAQTADGYVTVMNRDITHVRGFESHVTTLESRAALRALLNERFGFDLPEVLSLRVPAIEGWR